MNALKSFLARGQFAGDAVRLVSHECGRFDLARLFAACGFTRGAEIGVWTGSYSKTLCESIPGLRLTCVDPWAEYEHYHEAKNNQARLDDAYRQAVETLTPFGCEIVRQTSIEAAADVPDGSLDFVYVDANHGESFVAADLRAWAPKVRAGGIVAGHDYVLGVPASKYKHLEVTPAVDAYVAAHRIRPFYVITKDKTPSFFWLQP